MSELKGNTEIQIGSDRSFGLVFAAVFAIIGFFPLLRGDVRWWALAVAAVFLGLAFLKPDVLHPLNRLWFRFGLLLNRIVSPIILGFLFFVAVVPTGLLMRIWKRDLLRQRFDPAADSYWIPIDEDQRARSSMRNQF